ncbi:MAG: type III-B CRISPR module-associated protein Cmr3 [Armatimonadota bacterium]
MRETIVRIRGIDPLLFRDGRPFAAEIGALSARTLSCPYPATVTGFLRTLIGKRWGIDWNNKEHIQRVLNVAVQAPILQCNGEAVFHAPADAMVYKEEGSSEAKVMPLRPVQNLADGEGCNLPKHLVPLNVTEETKSLSSYALWKHQDLFRWLGNPTGAGFAVPCEVTRMEVEERVHVCINDKGTGEEGKLFSAQFLSFERYRWGKKPMRDEWHLLARVLTDEQIDLQDVGLLGGEKRLAAVEPASPKEWPTCPASLQQALQGAKRVRMMLVTPAIFQNGWKPGWLNGKLEGMPPSAPALSLKLVSAAVKRREAVSGWSYRADRQQPKPTRLLAPAGSVYFFEVLDGDPSVLGTQAWLEAVSDAPHDRRDGYGLAIWGIW